MLHVQHLAVFYGDVQALWDVSLQVNDERDCHPAGCRMVLARPQPCMPYRACCDRARAASRFRARRCTARRPRASSKPVSFTLPRAASCSHMTVLENLELGAFPKRARRLRRQSLTYVLDLFPRLRERQQQVAGTLSGGEQQMLAIGRGLMARPRLLMLDEPSLGLAPLLVAELFACIRRIHAEQVTILLVEQNVHQALDIADRAYVLENGRTIRTGTAAELLADDAIQAAYLGL